jgi:hypothetical protein
MSLFRTARQGPTARARSGFHWPARYPPTTAYMGEGCASTFREVGMRSRSDDSAASNVGYQMLLSTSRYAPWAMCWPVKYVSPDRFGTNSLAASSNSRTPENTHSKASPRPDGSSSRQPKRTLPGPLARDQFVADFVDGQAGDPVWPKPIAPPREAFHGY